MALGRRKGEQQDDLFILAEQLPKAPGHVFYGKLNAILREAGFDRWVEDLCQPYYAETQGRLGIPPGTYFRMLLIGYFEGIGSQRGIAWRLQRFAVAARFSGNSADRGFARPLLAERHPRPLASAAHSVLCRLLATGLVARDMANNGIRKRPVPNGT